METCKIKNLYNLKETIAKDLFEGAVYPWEVLPKISDFIKKLGATLSEEEYEKRVLDSMKCKGYVNEEPEIIGHLDKSVVNGGELIPGQKSGVVPVAVDKKGLLKKNSGTISTKDFETLIAHTKEKMKECGKAILDGKIEAIPYVYEDNDGCTYCPYGSVCGHESKKDGVREMKKMSDDEVWEALYGDD